MPHLFLLTFYYFIVIEWREILFLTSVKSEKLNRFMVIIHTGTCLQLFVNWKSPAHWNLSRLIWWQKNFFCKQTCQSLQFFKGKPTDGISCVPLPIMPYLSAVSHWFWRLKLRPLYNLVTILGSILTSFELNNCLRWLI